MRNQQTASINRVFASSLPEYKLNRSKEFSKVAIRKVIWESIKERPKADEMGIEIQKNIVHFNLLGNKDSLVNLVTIVLDNAVKYSKKRMLF